MHFYLERQINMSKIVENYIYNVLYQAFILIVPLLTAPYLARVLGATNLGIYSYIYSASAIISTITLLGFLVTEIDRQLM